MRKVTWIVVGICVAVPLLWFGVMLAGSFADPASARWITVQVSGAPGIELNGAARSVVDFVDIELLRRGFIRDQQKHDLDGTNWVTVYSYKANHYPAKTDVLWSGCKIHEAAHEVRIELWELGGLRPSQQFAKIRHELKDALISKCGKGKVD